MKIVFILNPDSTSCRTIGLDDPSFMALWRCLKEGADTPQYVSGQWADDEQDLPPCDFPNYGRCAPIISDRIRTTFEARLEACGKLIPVLIDGVETGQWAFVVTKMVRCLDLKRSSKIKRDGSISRLELIEGDVDGDVAAFRIPEIPKYTFWNKCFVDDLLALELIGVEAFVVWASDPAIPRRESILCNR